MSDAVMVPRKPLEPVVYGDERDELLALIRKRCPDFTAFPECPPEDMVKGGDTERKNDEAIERAFQDFRLAAFPSVGGWEDDPYLATDLALVNDLIYQHGGDAALAGWVRLCRRITAAPPPPLASTGSRPQEAVPSEGHDAAVVTPEDWWIEWPGGARPVDRYTLVTIRRRDGREVCDKAFKFNWYVGTQSDIVAYRVEAVTLAEGCSSNEGAGK